MKPRIAVFLPTDWEKEGKREKYRRYLVWITDVGGEAIPVVGPRIPDLTAFAGFLFTGGEDVDPRFYGEPPRSDLRNPLHLSRERDEFELEALQKLLPLGKPVLGICRGLQLLNVGLGGSLHQDLETALDTPVRHRGHKGRDAEHPVLLEWGSRLFLLMGTRRLLVNSSHHQGIKVVGRGLRVTAWAEDRVVEGVELPDHPFFLGVQWHPERYPSPMSRKLAEAFVRAAEGKRK